MTVSPTPEMIEAFVRTLFRRSATDAFHETTTYGKTQTGADWKADIAEALTAALSVGWRGIASAPRDGTKIIVWRPDEGDGGFDAHAGIDRWNKNCWWCSRRDQQPTHWQPLPPPPERKDG